MDPTILFLFSVWGMTCRILGIAKSRPLPWGVPLVIYGARGPLGVPRPQEWFRSMIEATAWVINQPVGKSCSTFRGTPTPAHHSLYALYKILDSIESDTHIYGCVCVLCMAFL